MDLKEYMSRFPPIAVEHTLAIIKKSRTARARWQTLPPSTIVLRPAIIKHFDWQEQFARDRYFSPIQYLVRNGS